MSFSLLRLLLHVGILGEEAQLVIINNIEHTFIIEKPKEIFKHLKSFLIDLLPPPRQHLEPLTP